MSAFREPVLRRELQLDGPLDLARTLFPLRRGHADPTMRIGEGFAIRALRTLEGPATLSLSLLPHGAIDARALGPGAELALEVEAPGLAGALDDASGFDPTPEVVRRLWRRHRGVRLTQTAPMPVLLAAVLEQKVTGVEARRAWRGLVRATSEPAPGDAELWLPPDPARVATLPSFAFHRFGVESRRAGVCRSIGERAEAVDRLAARPQEARAWLERLPGIGVWTSAEVSRLSLGDADAVSVGDYHLPNLVAWVLAGEPRADDARMLELLEPYRGNRGRVQRLLEADGASAPRFGPRADARSIRAI